MENSSPERMYTIRETMRLISVRQKTLMQWRESGGGPRYVVKHGQVRYPASAIDDWLAATSDAPQSPVPEVAQSSTPDRRRAMCCECGSLRLVSRQKNPPNWTFDGLFATNAGRCLGDLKCDTCRATTRHAVLRDDRWADNAEEWLNSPSSHQLACQERDELVKRLRGFNVAVEFSAFGSVAKNLRRNSAHVVSVGYDTSSDRWELTVHPAAPPQVQTLTLKDVWEQIASNDFDDAITWDPQDGWWAGPSTSGWEGVSRDLMSDVSRYLDVERLKMAAEIKDSPAALSPPTEKP